MTERTVSVVAVGEASAPADTARVRLQASAEADVATRARDRARDLEARVRDALVTEGFEGVRTTGFELHDSTDAFGFDGDAEHRAVVSMVLDCSPADAYDAVVAATDAGASVDDVRFSVAGEHREGLRQRAIRVATERARKRATALADAEGRSVAGLVDASIGSHDSFDSIVDEALAGDGADGFEPDPVQVEMEIQATYELGGE